MIVTWLAMFSSLFSQLIYVVILHFAYQFVPCQTTMSPKIKISFQEWLAPLLSIDTYIARLNDMRWMLQSTAKLLEQDHSRASDQLRAAACNLQITIEYFEATRWHQLLQIRISLQYFVRRYGRFPALDIYGRCGWHDSAFICQTSDWIAAITVV